MKTVTETVTPTLAELWLQKNTSNRNVSTRLVAKYADMMARGQWSLTHQGIAFYADGTLADGQHRLKAVVKAGVPVVMQVSYGIEREAGCDIDVHRIRKTTDSIKIGGLSDWMKQEEVAIVRMATELDGETMSIRDIAETGEHYKHEIQTVIRWFPSKRKGITSAPILSAFVTAAQVERDHLRLEHMAACLLSGIIESIDDSAAIRLREIAMSGISHTGGTARKQMFLRTQRAIKAFVARERIQKLYVPSGLIYPMLRVPGSAENDE